MRYLLTFLLFFPAIVFADNFTLAWEPVTVDVSGAPVIGLLGYKVYKSSVSGTYTTSVITTTEATAEIIENTVGTYFAVVRAYNSVGESGPSNEVSFTVVGKVPGVPQNLSVSRE